jgi:hypothetical protein
MLGNLGEIQRNMQGIGVVIGTQRPFLSFLVKNWPLTAVAAWGLYARGKHRWDKNEFTSYNLLADAGLILSPLIGLAILNQIAQQDQLLSAMQSAQAPPVPVPSLPPIQSAVGPPMVSS